MASTFKPAGHSSVSPYLVVDGAAQTIDFVIRVFGATELLRIADDTGRVKHAEVRIDDTVIMLGDGRKEWPPIAAHVHIYVPDVDETYRLALAAGAVSVMEPATMGDPDKRGGVKDAGGTTWWIATKMD